MKIMKYIISFFLFVVLLPLYLNAETAKKIILEGHVSGLPDSTVLEVLPVSHDKASPIASIRIKNGYFKSECTIPGPRAAYLSVEGGYPYKYIFLGDGNLKVSGNVTSRTDGKRLIYDLSYLKIEGSPLTDTYLKLLSVRDTLDRVYKSNNDKYRPRIIGMAAARREGRKDQLDSLSRTVEYRQMEAEEKAFFNLEDTTYKKVISANRSSCWGHLKVIRLTHYLDGSNKQM